jgi:hypothetical protein
MKKLFCIIAALGGLFLFTPAIFAQSGGGSHQDTLTLAVYFVHPGQAHAQPGKKPAPASKAEIYMAVISSRVRFYRITCIKCDILRRDPIGAYPIDGAATPVTDPVLKKELMASLKVQRTSVNKVVQKEK